MSAFLCKALIHRPPLPVTFPGRERAQHEEGTLLKRLASGLLTALFVAASLLVLSTGASASHGSLSGLVKDLNTGGVVPNVCVTIGPPIRCATMTKADGTYFVSLEGAPDGIGWDVRFLLGGQVKAEFLNVIVNGPTV